MEQQAREQAFISALTTEQFVLQAARSANVGEMTGRGTIYMGAVSSALIAFGFLAQVVTRLDPFVAAVLPAVFLLGEFTFAALLRNTLENLVSYPVPTQSSKPGEDRAAMIERSRSSIERRRDVPTSPSWGRRLARNTKIGLHIFYS